MEEHLVYDNNYRNMPNVFDNVFDKSYIHISIILPKENIRSDELKIINRIIVDINGYAFRTGGGRSSSLNQHSIGYILPKGTININQFSVIDRIQNKLELDAEPTVNLVGANVSEDKLEIAEIVGTPPDEALKGLEQFADDFNS